MSSASPSAPARTTSIGDEMALERPQHTSHRTTVTWIPKSASLIYFGFGTDKIFAFRDAHAASAVIIGSRRFAGDSGPF